MYERMLNNKMVPTENEIKKHIGEKAAENIELLKSGLGKVLDLNVELKFPFGNNYGWSYKLSHKAKHLFYLFFEKGSITATLQISKIKTEKEIEKYNQLSEEGKKYWENRYPCGENGGWIHYRITDKKQLKDIGILLGIKMNKEIKI